MPVFIRNKSFAGRSSSSSENFKNFLQGLGDLCEDPGGEQLLGRMFVKHKPHTLL